MKNDKKLKKYVLIILAIVIISLIVNLVFNIYELRKYRLNYNTMINNVIGNVLSKYDNITKDELIEVINTQKDSQDFLREYGIDLLKDDINNNQNIIKNKIILVNVLGIFSVSLIVLLLMILFNHQKDREISEIIKYLEAINNHNYSLEIDTNEEGELSILKNEILKITIMLKEKAEISQRDKINLKESLQNISHQLKTPLTSISIMLDNILNDDNMDINIRKEFIEDIIKEIDSINFLVYNILKLSKFDANVIEFDDRINSINDILNESIVKVGKLSNEKHVQILFECKDQYFIKCDRKWQIEAFSNIIKNCLEYTREFGKINITLEDNKLYTKIMIEDEGMGISKEDLPNIFKRFYKGKNAKSDSVGIGLSLAKAIISKDGGEINVRSIVDLGTTFEVIYFKLYNCK